MPQTALKVLHNFKAQPRRWQYPGRADMPWCFSGHPTPPSENPAVHAEAVEPVGAAGSASISYPTIPVEVLNAEVAIQPSPWAVKKPPGFGSNRHVQARQLLEVHAQVQCPRHSVKASIICSASLIDLGLWFPTLSQSKLKFNAARAQAPGNRSPCLVGGQSYLPQSFLTQSGPAS